jgi:hypothetical protein
MAGALPPNTPPPIDICPTPEDPPSVGATAGTNESTPSQATERMTGDAITGAIAFSFDFADNISSFILGF